MTHLQKSKNKDFGGAIVQKQYVFLRGTVKLYFEELGHRNLSAKNWLSSLYSFVTAHAKKFAHNSVYIREFCKDVQTFDTY